MNKYVVAYWSDHTGELLQELVEAHTAVDAIKFYMQWDDPTLTTLKSCYSYAANCDSMVSVVQISKPTTKLSGWTPEALAQIAH